MIYSIERFLRPLICAAFVLFGLEGNAQVALIQKALDKIEGYKNFSYQSIYKQREYTSDTLIIQYKDIFSKAPEDKIFGYLFSMELMVKGNKFPSTEVYNGQKLISISPEDSTYVIKEIKPSAIQRSMPAYLKTIKGLMEKRPSEIAGDTTINAIPCSHLIVNTYDTIIDKEHYYTRIHLFINKLTDMPDCIIAYSRSAGIGDGITNYYSEFRYSDYKFNQDNIDIASMTIPKGFHPPKERSALLAPGEVAPDWTLYTADGKKMSLTQMKGKVILLDFFFIGCSYCMRSLKPLNKLHEKYTNQNVALVSMTHRDSKKSVMEFKKQYNIKYPIYVDAADVVNSYHVESFPLFYFIDKEGKIANVINGYDEGFEEKATSIINGLLNKI